MEINQTASVSSHVKCHTTIQIAHDIGAQVLIVAIKIIKDVLFNHRATLNFLLIIKVLVAIITLTAKIVDVHQRRREGKRAGDLAGNKVRSFSLFPAS